MNYHEQIENFAGSVEDKLSLIDRSLSEKQSEKDRLALLWLKTKTYNTQEKYAEQREVYEEILPLARKHLRGEELIEIITEYTFLLFIKLSERQLPLDLSEEVVAIAEDDSTIEYSPYLAKAHTFMGILSYFFNVGKRQVSAFQHFKEALKIYTKLEDNYGIGSIYNNIGLMYKHEKKYAKAYQFFINSIDHHEASTEKDENYLQNYATGVCNAIECKIGLNEFEEATNLLEMIEAKVGRDSIISRSSRIFYWGCILYHEGKYDEVITSYLKIPEEDGFSFIKSRVLLGDISTERNQTQEAIDYYEEALTIGLKTKYKQKVEDIYDKLSQSYEKLGMFKKCIAILRVKEAFTKEISDEKQMNLSIKLKQDFDTRLKDQEILFKNKLIAAKEELNRELQLVNKELSAFASRLAHDLKAPLSLIKGYLSLIKMKLADGHEDLMVYFNHVLISTERMEQMIQALRQFAVLEKDRKAPEAVDLKQVVAAAITNLSTKLKEEPTEFTIADNLPAFEGYPGLLLILFQNLISNSLKFKRESPIKITVTGEVKEEEIIIAVGDNGIGIEEAASKRIFEMFTRLHSSSQYEGFGIGLATCKKIMEVHRGRIEVQSTLGVGTIFLLIFPIDT